jgi:hypothetical protein
VGDRREHERGHVLGSEHAEVARGEDDVAEQAEDADPGHLEQVDAGDPGKRERDHEHLQRIANHDVGGGDRSGVEVGVSDLDADEDQSRDGGCNGRRSGEESVGDSHLMLLVGRSVSTDRGVLVGRVELVGVTIHARVISRPLPAWGST